VPSLLPSIDVWNLGSMPNPEEDLTSAGELTAAIGKWFVRGGLVVVISGAIVGAITEHWDWFFLGVFGVLAFLFNCVLYRRQSRK